MVAAYLPKTSPTLARSLTYWFRYVLGEGRVTCTCIRIPAPCFALGMQGNILPMVEARLFKLTSHIDSARKGLQNTLKSWWRRPRTVASPPSAPLYSYSTVEAEIRMVADLAFMVQVRQVLLPSNLFVV